MQHRTVHDSKKGCLQSKHHHHTLWPMVTKCCVFPREPAAPIENAHEIYPSVVNLFMGEFGKPVG